ncbi:molybdopterin oxidoreductase, partial [Gordonia alkanivorans]|nr:molybdopterin oxidoreductase [Gordonia alkanivorans]
MSSTPHFLQGVFPFAGAGLTKSGPIDPSLTFVVPSGMTAQPLYFRG